jgi:uncharacterized repeat protein (TIGR02543 family)
MKGKQRFLTALFAAVLGLGLLAGCKDIFHSEEPEKYTVTFDADGGSPATQTRTMSSGASVGSSNMPTEPTKSGNTFGGWYTSRNGNGSPFTYSSTVSANIIVYAKWTVTQITITYSANGGTGTTPSSQTVNSGASVTLASGSGLTRSGYTFGGWNTNASGTGTSHYAGSSYSFSSNTTLYAKWTANAVTQITITYSANGGTGTTPSSQTINSGASVTLASGSDLTRSGYTFGGWDTNASGTGTSYLAGSSYNFSSNTTLYAKWTANAVTQITITYNANGGTGTTPSSQTIDSGASVTLASGSGLTRSGYTFDGWNTNASGAGTSYYAESSYSFSSNTTLYAKWTANAVTQITITYNANEGTGTTPSSQTIDSGASVTLASGSGLTRSDCIFGGWNTNTSGAGTSYSAGSSYSFSSNITLYAKWVTATLPSDLSLAQSLAWITSNAIEGGNYTVTLRNDETIDPQSLSYSGNNVNITLNGGTAERWVILSSSGSLFTVGSGVTLTLDNNVTLQGRSNNTASLVRVNSGGTLLLKSGSKITGNTSSSSVGGGVIVNGGTFTMSGGEISDNSAPTCGGGVYVYGTFTMSGGTISNNSATYNSTYSYYGGGGIYISDGTFTMSGGTISGNTTFYHGGGVYVFKGTFMMSGGDVSSNTVSSSPNGGGGGFSAGYGGGVYVSMSGVFIKQSSGIIYGSNASTSLKNTVKSDNSGHAVYVYSDSGSKKRNSTAGVGTTLNSGSAGGWE